MAENTSNAENIVETTHNRSSSDEEDYPNKKCKHVKESVNVKTVKKKVSSLKASDIECVTCAKSSRESSPPFTPTIDSVSDDIPREESPSTKDTETLQKKVIQLCLACGELHCGRDDKGHAVRHSKENKDHAISLNLDTSQAWCYECDEFVVPSTGKNQVVAEAQALIRKHFKENNDDEEEERVSIFRKKGKNNSYQVTAPGLNNLGNTCFFNSVMQVVVGTSVLHDALMPTDSYHDPPHIDALKCVTATEEEVGPLTDAFKNFLREMWRTNDNTVSPRDLFSQISKKWQQFRGWRQQDSQELMRFLFDGVKSEELEHIKKLELQPQKSQSQYMETDYDYHDDDNDDDDDDDGDDDNNDNDDSAKEKKDIKKYESFIDACFGGNLVSVIVCDVCKHCSYSYEEFLDVSLPIKSSSKNSFGYSDYNNYSSSYGGSGPGFGFSHISNIGNSMFDSNDNSTNDDESGNKGEDENRNEEESSDIEKEEGIPVPNKKERTRIKLLLRDLPSDSGRSTPNPSKDVTLLDCLKSFVKVETLEGDNSFACDNCWKLKKDYEERKNEINGIDDTGDTGDTGDSVDISVSDSDNIKDDKNQTNGLETEENSQDDSSATIMEGIEYNNETDNRRSEVETGSSEVDNENSSDTSETVETVVKRDSNEFDNDDRINDDRNFLTTSESNESKPASEPERPYIFRKAYKRYLFDSLPPVMVFHLKRFQQVGGRWSGSVSMRKIDDFVAFDEELDVGDFVVPPEIEKDEENGINNGHIIDGNTESSFKQNKQHKLSKLSTKYRLYGVVVHLGSLYNGHYIAYVLSRNIRGEGEQFGISEYFHGDKIREFERQERQKHKTDDQRQWIYCSDSSVRSATVEEVLNTSGAYLLFYERVYE